MEIISLSTSARPKRKVLRLRLLKLLHIVLITLPCAIAWRRAYVRLLPEQMQGAGLAAVLLVFLLLYVLFTRIYGAFLISQSRISELVGSQFLSALLTDGFCWLLIALLAQRVPNVLPMLLALTAQGLVALLWTYWMHQWYFRTFPRAKSVLIYGDAALAERMSSDPAMCKRYDLERELHVSECDDALRCLDGAEVVFLAGVEGHLRDEVLKYALAHDVPLYMIPRIGDIIMSGAARIHMFHDPLLRVARYHPRPEYSLGKRLFDLMVSAVALVVLSPILLITALAVKLSDGGPVLYRQTRLTKDGKTFSLLKFRSMRVDAEADGVARLSTGAQDSRVTAVGRVLRKYRIDELPQLLNILAGDLSIVGPRPERPEIAAEYEQTLPEFRLRLQAKAGLTGYAQVYGKYNTDPYHKLQLDLMYIANPGFLEDLRICFATVKTLFMAESTEGVQEGMTTAMETEETVAASRRG